MADECLFVIEFFTKCETSPPVVVWSEDIELTEIFIKQHGFDPLNIKRYTIPAGKVNEYHEKIQPDGMLVISHMKSNTNNTIHTVVTSDEIIDSILKELIDDFIDTLSFGSLVVRNDVSFVSNIIETIESIDYASICDWELISDGVVDSYYSDDEFSQSLDDIPPPCDTSYIQDELFRDRTNNKILPITIEAYAHYFISTIIGI